MVTIRLRSVERLESRLAPAAGVFRIVSYNIAATGGTSSFTPGLETILQGIGNEVVAGNAQPIDVLSLQEVLSQSSTAQDVVVALNAIYGAGTYARGTVDGGSTGSGTQALVYNATKLQLISEAKIGVTSASGQPRQALRYKLHPIGYAASNDFYVYNSHAKADTGTTNENRRQVEAAALRADGDALGSVNLIYAGDFNTYTSAEPFYTTLFGAGAGQAADPLNRLGAWHETASFKDIFTQAPAVSPPNGLTGGGLDDRFDLQLISGELTDGSGLDYVPGSYHTFGNNGSVALNGNINAASSTALPGLANRTTVLDFLTTVTDHLPVVADYRILVPPTVAVVVENGAAQRSLLRSFTATFSAPVTFTGGLAAAFSLQRSGPGTPTGAVPLSFAQSGNAVTVTFNSATFAPGLSKSLIDGNYTLTINAANVLGSGGNLDGDGNGVGGGNRVVSTHRLFGDSDGDRDVDVADFIAFRTAFGAGASIFDADGDGDTDLADFTAFRLRFGTMI